MSLLERNKDIKNYRALCPFGHWYGKVSSSMSIKALTIKCPHCATAMKISPFKSKKEKEGIIVYADKRLHGRNRRRGS